MGCLARALRIYSRTYSTLFGVITLTLGACSTGIGDAARVGDGYGESSDYPYRIETLVSGGPLHGAKGIAFGPDGMLYVCSVYAESIYRVDVTTGEVSTAVGPPHGESDDVAFAPDGTMAWTALTSAEIRAQLPDGELVTVASKLPLINPLRYTETGRLFAAQIGIDRFLEIDLSSGQSPRLVAKGIGHLNSFEFGDDGHVYGPLAGVGTVARIDVESGVVETVAEDLGTISAVKFDSRGIIYAVGWSSGQVLRIAPDTGAVEEVALLDPPLDNLAIGSDDAIYVSQPARGAIVRVDPNTGEQADVVPGNLSVPGGLALTTREGRETLVTADDFGFRLVDTESGEVTAIADLTDFMEPAAATDVAISEEVFAFSDVSRSLIYLVDPATGKRIQKWRRVGTPYGLLLSKSGEPIFADFASGELIRLSRNDRKARDILADGLDGPVDIVWGGEAGVLFVSEAVAGRITRINLEQGLRSVIAEGLAQPEGLALLADNRIAVVEVGAQRVIALDPDTGASEVLATNLPVGRVIPNTPAPVHIPSSLAVGENNALYLSSDRDQSILRLMLAP